MQIKTVKSNTMSTISEKPDPDCKEADDSTTITELEMCKQEHEEVAKERVDEMGDADAESKGVIVCATITDEQGDTKVEDLRNVEFFKPNLENHRESIKREEFGAMRAQDMEQGGDDHEERENFRDENDGNVDSSSKHIHKDDGDLDHCEESLVEAKNMDNGSGGHGSKEKSRDRDEITTDLVPDLIRKIDMELDERKESGAKGGCDIDEGTNAQGKSVRESIEIDASTDLASCQVSENLKRRRERDEKSENLILFSSGDRGKILNDVKRAKSQEEENRAGNPTTDSSKNENNLKKNEILKPVKVEEESQERIGTVKSNNEQNTLAKVVKNSGTDVRCKSSVKVLKGPFLVDPIANLKRETKYSLCWK